MSNQATQGGCSFDVAGACLVKKAALQTGDERDLRKFTRYSRILAVMLSWTGKKPMFSEGLTRDISAGGAFIHLNRCPPAGTVVHYEVFLPAVSRKGPDVRIAGSGQIVRVEKLGGAGRWRGVAIRFSKQVIRVRRLTNME